MNITDFPLALTNMGYRQPDSSRDPNRWVKPIGYDVLIAFVEELKIAHYFVGVDKKLHCWDDRRITLCVDGDLELQIATYEVHSAIRMVIENRSYCHAFLSQEQRANLIVGI